MKNALCNGKTIEIRKFGTFKIRHRKARDNSRNPKTGEKAKVNEHSVVAFTPGKELKEKIWNLKEKK